MALTINKVVRKLPPETKEDSEFFGNLSTEQVNKLIGHLHSNFDNFYKANFSNKGYNREESIKKLNSEQQRHQYPKDERRLILEIPKGHIKAQENIQDDTHAVAYTATSAGRGERKPPAAPPSTPARAGQGKSEVSERGSMGSPTKSASYSSDPEQTFKKTIGSEEDSKVRDRDKVEPEEANSEGDQIVIVSTSNHKPAPFRGATSLKPDKRKLTKTEENKNIGDAALGYSKSKDRVFVVISENLEL